jgi:saccharopine dehydrogenase-like NADP-dependent oxidoreductase
MTTAAGICAAIDLFRSGHLPQQGFLRQEQIELDAFLDNRFGCYYRSKISTRFTQSAMSDVGEDEEDE